jgi:hypothetical protein
MEQYIKPNKLALNDMKQLDLKDFIVTIENKFNR